MSFYADLTKSYTVIGSKSVQDGAIQQDTLTISDPIPVEPISKNLLSCSKVLKYGIHYRSTSKMLRPLVYSSV